MSDCEHDGAICCKYDDVVRSQSQCRPSQHTWERQRDRESPLLLLTSLSSAELSATDRRHSGLRAVSLLSTHSNSIIHKKSLRFLRKIKVAYICLYSINEMIDRYVIRYYMVKTKTQLFVLVK